MNEVLLVCVVGCGQRRNWVESFCRVLPGTFSGAALFADSFPSFHSRIGLSEHSAQHTPLASRWHIIRIESELSLSSRKHCYRFCFKVPEGRRTRTASPFRSIYLGTVPTFDQHTERLNHGDSDRSTNSSSSAAIPSCDGRPRPRSRRHLCR